MSCCEDGSICLWRLGDESAKATQHLPSSSRMRLEESELNLECLVLRADWDDRGKKLDNVIRQLEEVKRNAELQIKAVEQECSQKTYAAESRHNDQFDRAIDKIQVKTLYYKVPHCYEYFIASTLYVLRNWKRS